MNTQQKNYLLIALAIIVVGVLAFLAGRRFQSLQDRKLGMGNRPGIMRRRNRYNPRFRRNPQSTSSANPTNI